MSFLQSHWQELATTLTNRNNEDAKLLEELITAYPNAALDAQQSQGRNVSPQKLPFKYQTIGPRRVRSRSFATRARSLFGGGKKDKDEKGEKEDKKEKKKDKDGEKEEKKKEKKEKEKEKEKS